MNTVGYRDRFEICPIAGPITAGLKGRNHEMDCGGASMLTFGGDHFSSYPQLRAHTEKSGLLSTVQIDARC